MAKRFYFSEFGNVDSCCADYVGNIRGAKTYAEKVAAILKQDIYINDCRDDSIVAVSVFGIESWDNEDLSTPTMAAKNRY